MFSSISQRISFSIALIGIYTFAWYWQSQLFLNYDVNWLLLATQRLLAGGNYLNHFLETNPPLILFLYIPPVLLNKYFAIHLAIAFRIYIFILASLSLLACYEFVIKIFKKEDKFLITIFLCTLLATYLILPIYEFGQRDSLLFILTMPYFLLLVFRLQNQTINSKYAVAIGLFAGLGFALKPFFLVTFLLQEAYFAYAKKTIKAVLRPEVFAIATVVIIYCLVLLAYFQDYLYVLVPYTARLYYPGLHEPWFVLLTNAIFLFCCLPILLHLIQLRKTHYSALKNILCVALLGFLASYLMQQTTFYYHILPAFSVSLVLLVTSFTLFAAETETRQFDYVLMILAGAVACFYLLKFTNVSLLVLTFNPWLFFGFFTALFTWVGCIAKPKPVKTILTAIGIGCVSFIFCDFTKQTSLYEYCALLSCIFMFILFALFLPRDIASKLRGLFLVILGGLLFSFPICFANNLHSYSVKRPEQLANLIQFMRTHAANKSVSFMTTTITTEFLSLNYANAIPVSRFAFLAWLPGILKHPDSAVYTQDKNFLIKLITDDLNTTKPDLVFVDASPHKAHLENIAFDYLKFFSQDKDFAKAWKNYRYIGSVEQLPLYKFDVFSFSPPTQP